MEEKKSLWRYWWIGLLLIPILYFAWKYYQARMKVLKSAEHAREEKLNKAATRQAISELNDN